MQNTTCFYCASEIAENAKLCPACGRYRRRWLNYIRADHISLLIAFGIMVVAYLQFIETKKDRIEAAKILERVESVEENLEKVEAEALARVKSAEENLKKVETEIKSLREAAEQGAGEIAKILDYVRSVQKEVDKMRSDLEKMDKRIGDLPRGPTAPALKFSDSRFELTASGLRGTVTFEPTSNASLSSVDFKVTVLQGSVARITKISPGIPISLMVSSEISADGKRARLKYTIVGTSKPSFSIELTGPAKLRIEGEPGIQAFELKANNHAAQ